MKNSSNFTSEVLRMLRALNCMTTKIIPRPPDFSDADKKEYDETVAEIRGKPVYNRLVETFEKTIKGDKRAIEFLLSHELSAFTTDPSNLGMEAPTSEGKTYPVVEVVKRSPSDYVWFLGGLSPTALVHDYGELVDKDGKPVEGAIETRRDQIHTLKKGAREAVDPSKKSELMTSITIAEDELKELLKGARHLINMEDKIIVFLEAPVIETWEKLRPVLSHDVFEISYKFTDKTAGGSLKTSHVVIRGWPAVMYLKASRGKEDIIWDEIQSRFTTISPKMSIEKYRAAIIFSASQKGLPGPAFERTMKFEEFKWAERVIKTIGRSLMELKYNARRVSQELNPNMFWVPFYEEIGREFPATEGRNMRDSRRFFTLLQMSAAIEQFNRPYLKIGDAKFIVVVREDYERAVALFFGEAGEEIFSGIPADVVNFFKKVPLAMHKRGEPISISGMVKESKMAFKRAKSAKVIRNRHIGILETSGMMSGETDPEDKRQKVYEVLSEEIIPKNAEIYSLFKNGTYFNAVILESRLNDLLKIFLPEEANTGVGVFDWDGTPLTAAQLWEKYYARNPGILEEYLRTLEMTATEEQPQKVCPESETGGKGHISAKKGGKLEDFEKPPDIPRPAPSLIPVTLQTVIEALEPFRGGGQISKTKLAGIIGTPETAIREFLDELVTRGAIIDRGAMVEVL